MLNSLEAKAKLYYGGDFTFIGGQNELTFPNVDDFIEKLTPVFPSGSVVSSRFDFDADYSSFYFEGIEARQRVIKGIDFSKEMKLFQGFNYLEGNPLKMAGSNGVLLSEPIAETLGVQVGDSITFLLKTIKGYTNTVVLEVHGIFRDSSLFGMYTSYMDISCLRKSYDVAQTWANRICIDFPADFKITQERVENFQTQLEQKFTMFPLVDDKEIFYESLLNKRFSEPHYALVDLYANLEDLKVLIDAMKIVATFVILILMVIIMVGVSSTYRVIVMKRINEIGIYKAIGMNRMGIFSVLLSETSLLILVGCVAGIIFSWILCGGISLFSFSFIPAFDIFLVDGKLLPKISFLQSVLISVLVYVTTTFAVLFSVQKSVRMTPVDALGVTE
ncbi:MAG: ABC transporter permease [Treponema sp.]|nr:ABC transporter permease [Treponema sp.]